MSERDSVAIIGMAGRFPGAKNIKEFWENIAAGKESISFFSNEELLAEGISCEEINTPHYIKAKGLIDDIDKFDAKFFNILPKEALILDPQQRILLECAWSAMEDAGYVSEKEAGRIGVFTGCGFNTYFPKIILGNEEFASHISDIEAGLANANDFVSTRISYKFNLTGPSITVQSACSTSLVAVALACNSLLDYQCDMAIAGGASAFFPIKSGYIYHKEFILSADGHCRPLDEKGSGTVYGMGTGIVILKRLADALRDQDPIYAVIRSSAINNDGSDKIGFTAPSQQGQKEVILEAQALAEIDTDTIGFLEAHATGTQLGDPIEIAALTEAFHVNTDKKNFCALGTVKANIGHLDAAAGIAGLIKTVLVLKNKKIPPAINFDKPNPKINFADSPFYVPTQLTEWKSNHLRRAAVSSFGVGGTNAHVILEEAPQRELISSQQSEYLFLYSAKSENALKQKVRDFLHWLEKEPEPDLYAVSFTLNAGRKHFEYRYAVIASSVQELKSLLSRHCELELCSGEAIDLGNTVSAEESTSSLRELAAAYLSGETIHWEDIYGSSPPYRISLPAYPFERIPYWIPQKQKIVFYHPVWREQTIQDGAGSLQHASHSSYIAENRPQTSTLIISDQDFPEFNNYFASVIQLGYQKHFSEYQQLLTNLKTIPSYVVFLLNQSCQSTEEALEKTIYAVMNFVKAWIMNKSAPLKICYFYSLDINPFTQPFAEALYGFFKTIELEYPSIKTQLISSDNFNIKIITDNINSADKIIRYLKNIRYINQLEEIQLTHNPAPFSQKGVYLITGGAHGLGKIIGEWLEKNFNAQLILIGRSSLRNAISKTAIYEQADVSDYESMKKIILNAKRRFGKINGVIHCAGMIHDALILKKSEKNVHEVLSPKIQGTLNLVKLTRDMPLDFFVLFSSISSIFGNIGQGDYAYANSFMDAFANINNDRLIAIDWPPWMEGGMQLSETARAWMKKNWHAEPLSTEKGLELFKQICAQKFSQVVVLPGSVESVSIDAAGAVGVDLGGLRVEEMRPPLGETRPQIIRIIAELTNLQIQDIPTNRSLFEMGVDSIVLAQIISKIESDFNVSLEDHLPDILTNPTVENIARFVEK